MKLPKVLAEKTATFGAATQFWDNAVVESFFKTLKFKVIYHIFFKIKKSLNLKYPDTLKGFIMLEEFIPL